MTDWRPSSPYDVPIGGECPRCGCAWAWHGGGGCSGDFMACVCKLTSPDDPALANVPLREDPGPAWLAALAAGAAAIIICAMILCCMGNPPL